MLKLEAIGFLGKDAEKKTLDSGKTVINFSIAHAERWKDKNGEQQERTTWVECAYWTEKTGIFEYLKKGKQVFIEGVPEVRTWEGKDGKTGASMSVRIREIQLLGSGTELKNSTQPKEQAPVHNIASGDNEEDISELPF